jgi:hypothetical protein
MKGFVIAAAAVVILAGSPALAQTYGAGGVGPGYAPQYNGPGWLQGRTQGGAFDAQAQGRRSGRTQRSPNDIGPNPVLPGRW